jgi:Fur family ferric uptake transcriptional regulator
MTTSHLTPPIHTDDLAGAVAELRRRGLRVSAARRLVLEAMFAADAPVSAERIATGLEGRVPVSDLASVYRNLEAFEQLGLVRHVHLGHGPGLYALAGRAERDYLACEACDRVQAVEHSELDEVRALIREAFGYEARFSHFPIVGLCPDCAAARARHDTEGDRA